MTTTRWHLQTPIFDTDAGRVAEGHPDGRLKIALFKSKSALLHNLALPLKSTSGVPVRVSERA